MFVLQVWKQKGEEYRVHGQWGWQWLSNSRNYKMVDHRTVGLRAGAQKYMVRVKGMLETHVTKEKLPTKVKANTLSRVSSVATAVVVK